jgi:hypothetical protein
MNYSSYCQSTFVEINREIFNKMQQDVQKVMNDFQASIEQMGLSEVYEDPEEEVTDNNTYASESLVTGEAMAAEYLSGK